MVTIKAPFEEPWEGGKVGRWEGGKVRRFTCFDMYAVALSLVLYCCHNCLCCYFIKQIVVLD
jgi:hypothetical protein